MLTGEIIDRVQSLYSKGAASDDSRLATMLIYNKLISVRARVFTQEFRKNRTFSDWDLQPLECVALTRQNSITCGLNTKCTFMKSTYILPASITFDGTENINVFSSDGIINYSRTDFANFKYIKGNKYGIKEVFYYVHDYYLYLLNSKMTTAYIKGIWRDPVAVYRLNATYKGETTCFNNKEVDFYTPLHLIESIIQLTVEELVLQFSQMREDISNDSNDSLIEQSK